MSAASRPPFTARTLLDVLRNAAEQSPDCPIIHVRRDGSESRGTHAELLAVAERVAGGLRAAGIAPRTPILLPIETSDGFLAGFWGALIAGLIPVPLAAEAERLRAVWSFLDRSPLLVDTALATRMPGLLGVSPEAIQAVNIDHLSEHAPIAGWYPATSDDCAYLQFSSGSTGMPKGVELTHANVTANLDQIAVAAEIDPSDIMVSWLPYFHDMGLVANHLTPLAGHFALIKMAPLHFAKRPLAWLELATRHRATILSTANFALGLTLRLVKPEQLANVDLSSVRLMTIGAEPISSDLCQRFLELLEPRGLRPEAMTPAYGMAEATVGVSLAPVDEPILTHVVERTRMAETNDVVVTEPGPGAVELVDLGFPFKDLLVRIVDETDADVGERVVGDVQVKGPNVAAGYYRIADNSVLFCGDWLRTGDRGFLFNGRLTVTGRAKDVLFVNGRKFHAVDLEELVGRVPGVRPAKVAVVGRHDQETGVERIATFVATDAAGVDAAAPILRQVKAVVQEAIGAPLDDLVLLPAGAFPHTTSGKLERYRLRQQLEAGEFRERADAVRTAIGDQQSITVTASASVAPRDDLERTVHAIWADVLRLDPESFGVTDRFLAIGGTSLQAMETLGRLEALHGHEIEPATLLDRPTVADLAAWLRDNRRDPISRAGSDDRRDASVRHESVAVIGMACRFPDASTPERFWDNLMAGRDSVGEIPRSRWDGDALYDPDGIRPNGSRSRWGSFLDDVAGFDAAYFGIDPGEARATDPQARLLLELAVETLERAGYPKERRQTERVGVFVGVGEVNYHELTLRLLHAGHPLHPATAVGNLRNLIAGRIANLLDLTGPVVAIDTACSSALVALHQARQSLLTGECDLALVGAVSLNLTPTPFQLLSRAGALSPTGHCRAFDDSADGIVLGEGAGMLLLTRQSRAEKAGDDLLAIVRGSAVNNDGRAISLMAPNPFRQQEVIATAYHMAGIDPATVGFVEAHGTGTPIGDPIEARSLAHVFPVPADGSCRFLGAVKTNLGHLLNACGLPGLMKAIMTVQHGQIPPTLHYQQANRRFDIEAAGLTVNTEPVDWLGESPRRAGVNAFGFGGTNAHVILEQAPDPVPVVAETDESVRPHLVLLSARTDHALTRTVKDLTLALAWRPDLAADPASVAFSVSTARDPFAHRLAFVTDGPLLETLRRVGEGENVPSVWRGQTAPSGRPRVAFLFSGQGAQYPGQGRMLAEADPVFRGTFLRASELAGPIRDRLLHEWCWDDGVGLNALAQTDLAQPLLVGFEVALGRMALAWGIEPDAVAGHSVGEIAAACLAGAISLESAMALAVERGRLMADLSEAGGMSAVFAAEDIVRAAIDRRGLNATVAVAAINDPAQTVLAGRVVDLERLSLDLENQGYRSVPLSVSHAFHSPLMTPMLEPFSTYLAGLPAPGVPAVPFLSTVSTDWVYGTRTAIDAAYWVEHVSRPVRFSAVIERFVAEGIDTFVEIGPGSNLVGMVRNTLRGRDGIAIESLLQRGEHDLQTAFGAAARLWVRGVDLDRHAIEGGRVRKRLPLVTYPFEREHYWLPDPPTSIAVGATRTSAPLDASQRAPDEINQLLAVPVWVETAPHRADRVDTGRWVITTDGGWALGEATVSRFRHRGLDAVLTPISDLQSRLREEPPVSSVLHIAAFGRPDAVDDGDLDELQHRLEKDLAGVLTLARQISELPAESRPARVIVTSSDSACTGPNDRVLAPERAAALGFATAIADDIPNIASLAVDLTWQDGLDAAADQLTQEALATPSSGLVAWRGGTRFQRQIRTAAVATTQPVTLRGEALYLIVGGAEGIGAEIARHLAVTVRPELVLVGRSALADAPKRQALIAELERSGARVSYEQVDVTDAAAVAALIERVSARRPITGVVQAAGIVQPAPIAAKALADIRRVLLPKTRALWAMDRALRRARQQPEFVVAFSSISSVLPHFGGFLSDYVAANAFVDAYAAAQQAAGTPFLAINWSAWAETGMSAAPTLLQRVRENGIVPLSTHQAVRAFERLVTTGARGQVAVLDGDPVALSQPRDRTVTPAIERQSGNGHLLNEHVVDLTPVASIGEKHDIGDIEQLVQELVAASLNINPADVPLDRSFMSLGLQSLVAVDLVKQLERQTDVTLPMTLFFEYPTVRSLSAYLATVLPPPVLSLNGTSVTTAVCGQTPATSEGTSFPLTPVQLAFYVTSRLYSELPTLSLLRETIEGPFETSVLLQAYEALIKRHQMLRARVLSKPHASDGPLQEIVDADSLIAARDGWFEERIGSRDINGLEEEVANTIFDLGVAPLFRIVLQREEANRAHLVMVAHHLVCDAWSLTILSDELWSIYRSLREGTEPSLPPVPISFADYVSTAREAGKSAEADADRQWWAVRMPGLVEASAHPLPYDGAEPGTPTSPIKAVTCHLTVAQTAALKRLAAAQETSIFALLLSVYGRTLARWSGRREFVISLATAGRHHRLPGIERLVGTCADVLPMKVTIDPEEHVASLSARLHAEWIELQRHNRLTSVDLSKLLGRGGRSRPRSLGDVSFSFAQFPGERQDTGPVRLTAITGRTGSAAMSLTLLGWDAYGAIGLSWNYPASLLRSSTVEHLANDFLAELTALIEPDPIDPPQVETRRQNESDRHDHAAVAPLPPEAIRTACVKWADNKAIEFDGNAMTYRELLGRSDQLSAKLVERGARRNQPVALLTYRGFEAVLGITGAMGAGAPWLPLDPDAPIMRLLRQLEIADVAVLIYERRTEAVAVALRDALGRSLATISASDLPARALADASTFIPVLVEPDDLAYVIFTSGSTGEPKGVPITQQSFGLYLEWIANLYPMTEVDRPVANSAVFFDASAYHLICPLRVGATVVPISEELMRDPDGLIDFIDENRISVWRGVASVWERILTAIERRMARGEPAPPLANLRLFTLGGEAMYAGTVRRWMDIYGDRQTIVNDYGPAEATITMTYYQVPGRPEESVTRIPIGWPIGTVTVLVLDELRHPVRPGELGELYIAGPILSPGYLSDPALTAQFFVDIDGQRMYRTRDLVIQRVDGCLEFVGRSDDQVKINGIRIELGDIEAALAGFPGVARAAVVKVGATVGTEHLIAFLATLGGAPALSELRVWLKDWLPAYMIPRRFVVLDQLPLTATGKVDRRALAERPIDPEQTLAETRVVSLETPTERIVAEIWADVLGLPDVSRDDDFFALGGDSIRMLDVLVQLEGRVPSIPRAVTFYRNPTVAAFAHAIDIGLDAETVPSSRSSNDETRGAYSVTPAQAGFILTEAIHPGVAQNWCASLIMDGPLDEVAFRCAIDYVVARHPMLRTIFPAGMRPPKQIEVTPDRPLEISFDDLSNLPNETAQRATLDRLLQREREVPIAIDRWPLLRMRLCRLQPNRHAWVIAAHHLIGDGMSVWVLGQDILRAYDRLHAGIVPDLPPLRSTFRDYVELGDRDTLLPRTLAEEHWRTVFAAPYQTPTDWRRPDTASTERSLHIAVDLDADTLHRLKQRATSLRLTLYPLVLAAYARQLGRLTGRNDLVIGTALSGRDHPLPDITHVFGCFATGVPLRIVPPVGTAIEEISPNDVAAVFVNALQHALPPSRIARMLPNGMRLDTAIGSQFFFTFVDVSTYGELESDVLRVQWGESDSLYDPPVAGVDLLVAAQPSVRGLRITVQAASSAFTSEMANAFAQGVAAELRAMVDEERPAQNAPEDRQIASALQFERRPLASLAMPRPDAALIGYLPPISDILGVLASDLDSDGLREFIRDEFFPDRQPRWMERIETDLGSSAFVCIPWFADELLPTRTDRLIVDVVEAIRYAGKLGARSVSLAGMIPSLTGYGYALARALEGSEAPELTTGHSTTVVSVVKSVTGALAAIDATLTNRDLAVVGLGSIGFASLQLLLDRLAHPRRIILCDAENSTQRLRDLATRLRDQGFHGKIDLVEATPTAPDLVYSASVIVGATSNPNVIEVDRLQPGTIVIDDSFPSCFDHDAAIARMQRQGDVLLTGGGGLHVRSTRRLIYLPDVAEAFRERIAAALPLGDMASCQLESILRAVDSNLPQTLGLVTLDGARAYAEAVERAGVRAGALLVGEYEVEERVIASVREIARSAVLPVHFA